MRRQIVMLVDAWDIAILKVMMNRLIFVRDVRNIQATEKDGEIGMTEQEKRERVIKGLECCILGNKHEPDCDVCPYSAGCNDTCDTMDEIHGDAIALLKAHEPIAPVKVNRYMETDENGDWFSRETYDCGNCGVELHGKANYCHLCGIEVKWE